MPLGHPMRRWLATVGLLGAVGSAWAGLLDGGRQPSAFIGTVGRVSREGIGSRCCDRARQRLYMNGNNDKNGNNKDRLDELYYQRFMGGMSDAEVTDEIPADLIDVEPGAIDSLWPKQPVDERGRTLGGAGPGFLDSVKKAMPGSFNAADPSMGPRVYIIPQNQGEAPLEVRSVAPGQRNGRKGVIAEIPGRNLKRSRRMLDIPNAVDLKRTIKEAPTRLTELQVQNLRSSTTTRQPSQPQSPSAPTSFSEFSFPTFPAPPSSMNSKPSSSFTRLTKSQKESSMDPRLSAMSRDWRVWVGLIAAVSFVTALVNALSYRSELIVMNEGVKELVKQAGAGIELLA